MRRTNKPCRRQDLELKENNQSTTKKIYRVILFGTSCLVSSWPPSPNSQKPNCLLARRHGDRLLIDRRAAVSEHSVPVSWHLTALVNQTRSITILTNISTSLLVEGPPHKNPQMHFLANFSQASPSLFPHHFIICEISSSPSVSLSECLEVGQGGG